MMYTLFLGLYYVEEVLTELSNPLSHLLFKITCGYTQNKCYSYYYIYWERNRGLPEGKGVNKHQNLDVNPGGLGII